MMDSATRECDIIAKLCEAYVVFRDKADETGSAHWNELMHETLDVIHAIHTAPQIEDDTERNSTLVEAVIASAAITTEAFNM